MEPVTHILTGAVLGRAGFNRRAAYATATMALAAELPDIDTVWSFGGPVTGFLHHRGITHTLVALPVEAALVTAVFWAWHRWRSRRAGAKPTRAPFSAGWLFAGTLVALASHLLLDWTNNYGLRPFFPFNPRWYAGSFVFIFEPVLFALLVLALVLPALFGLVSSEVGSARPPFRGRTAAWLALLGVLALYGLRWSERQRALHLAEAALSNDEPATYFACPYPVDPFTWHVIASSPGSMRLGTVDTRRDLATAGETFARPAASLAELAAKRSYLGRVYLDWSMFPVVAELPAPDADPRHPLTEVRFSDARFLYDTFLLRGRTHAPLTGVVTLDMQAPEGDRVVEQTMDGREQK